MPRRVSSRSGQAIIESFVVILLISLLLFGLLQVITVFNAREILHHSAARAARARSVGFNHWMVTKSMRVAAIPNSGEMLEPQVDDPPNWLNPQRTPGQNWDAALRAGGRITQRAAIERARVPDYLAAENHVRGNAILNYRAWEENALHVSESSSGGAVNAGTLRVTVRQRYPLLFAMHKLFDTPYSCDDSCPLCHGGGCIALSGEAEEIEHYSLYMDDMGW